MACVRDAVRMNVMEEVFEIRCRIEILVNDIKVNTADEYMFYISRELQGIHIGGSSSFRR